MNQEDIQKTLEAISKSGITVAGDLVLEKKVEYEVNNVENGGIGIQIINGEKNSQSVSDKKELSKEQLASAIENCQEYFWAKSAYAVLFCLLRDDYKKELSQAGFERMIATLPYKKNWIMYALREPSPMLSAIMPSIRFLSVNGKWKVHLNVL